MNIGQAECYKPGESKCLRPEVRAYFVFLRKRKEVSMAG